jgi:hypothetical protein
MTSVKPPPIRGEMLDKKGIITWPWLEFFDGIFQGDAGKAWTPTFVSLGATGTPVHTGFYYKISSRLTYFRVIVTPATDTTSTAGTTYIDNFPLLINADGQCLASAGTLGSTGGSVISSNNRIYVPGWTAQTVPVTITGTIEAK